MLGNKLLNIQFAKYHIWNNKSKGFPNMVLCTETFNQSLRTEYSEAVNVRYKFHPLWVSGVCLQFVLSVVKVAIVGSNQPRSEVASPSKRGKSPGNKVEYSSPHFLGISKILNNKVDFNFNAPRALLNLGNCCFSYNTSFLLILQ